MGQCTKVLADHYMRKIVHLHGIPVIIVMDRDTRDSDHGSIEVFRKVMVSSSILVYLVTTDKPSSPIGPSIFLIIFVR